MDTVRIRVGDSYPEINLTLRDSNTGEPGDPSSWSPIDLESAETSVRVDFREIGDSDILATADTTKVSGGSDGEVYFRLPSEVYDAVGTYQGEIVIERSDGTETVLDRFKVKVLER